MARLSKKKIVHAFGLPRSSAGCRARSVGAVRFVPADARHKDAPVGAGSMEEKYSQTDDFTFCRGGRLWPCRVWAKETFRYRSNRLFLDLMSEFDDLWKQVSGDGNDSLVIGVQPVQEGE